MSGRTSLAAILVLAAGLAPAAISCKNSDTLTGPAASTATPAASTLTPMSSTPTVEPATSTPTPSTTPLPTTPTPAGSLDLRGDWHGTVRYLDPDWWFPCGDRAINPDNSATATISQNGSTITATIHTDCISAAHFQGSIEVIRLTGTMNLVTGRYSQTGTASGSAGPSQIQLSTPLLDVVPSACPGYASCQMGGFTLSLSR